MHMLQINSYLKIKPKIEIRIYKLQRKLNNLECEGNLEGWLGQEFRWNLVMELFNLELKRESYDFMKE